MSPWWVLCGYPDGLLPRGKEDRLSLLQGQTSEVEMFRKKCPNCRISILWIGYPEEVVSYWTHVTSARPWQVSYVTQGILCGT